MEIDQVVVDKLLWAKAKGGDRVAAERIGKALEGIVIYFHIMNYDEGIYERVSLRELESANIINSVTLHRGIP